MASLSVIMQSLRRVLHKPSPVILLYTFDSHFQNWQDTQGRPVAFRLAVNFHVSWDNDLCFLNIIQCKMSSIYWK